MIIYKENTDYACYRSTCVSPTIYMLKLLTLLMTELEIETVKRWIKGLMRA